MYSGSTPHPEKVANKVKFLGIPYTKKYNLYTLIMALTGILGGGGYLHAGSGTCRGLGTQLYTESSCAHEVELRPKTLQIDGFLEDP